METIIEIRTPLPRQLDAFLEMVSEFNSAGSIILCEEGGISSVVIADVLQKKFGGQLFLKITCANRNRIAIHSELSTAASLGFSSIIIVDGAHPLTTAFPSAKPVYDLDAFSLLRALKDDSAPFFKEVSSLREMAEWKIGVCIGGSTKADLIKAEKLMDVGADFIFTRSSECILHLKDLSRKPVILSVPGPRTNNFSLALQQAEAAGADGVNIIIEDFGVERVE